MIRKWPMETKHIRLVCGESPALLVAANRYRLFYDDHA